MHSIFIVEKHKVKKNQGIYAMAKSTSDFIDRLVARLDRLDPNSVQGYVLKLVREKGMLETLFRTIREGVIIINRELVIEYVNHAAIQLLGIPEDAADGGHGVNRYLRDLDWDRLMSRDPEEWERISRQEIEVFYPRYRALLFYLLPYQSEFDPENKLGMAIIVLHDVTELRDKAMNQIETERLNAISILAAGVAHEIGNPLNSLTIHLQLLERHFDDSPQDEDAREILGVALSEVKRLDGIINNFLKAVRPSVIEKESVNLRPLLEDSLKVLSPEIKDRMIDVYCEWDDNLPKVMVDSGQMTQAFHNVIRNAVQAMSEGGRLEVKLKRDDGSLKVSFHDDGKGIAPDDIDKIFTPYQTTRETGTGLGLVIVERIIREHGAELGIESEFNRGTVVTITFPLSDRRVRMLEPPNESLTVEAFE